MQQMVVRKFLITLSCMNHKQGWFVQTLAKKERENSNIGRFLDNESMGQRMIRWVIISSWKFYFPSYEFFFFPSFSFFSFFFLFLQVPLLFPYCHSSPRFSRGIRIRSGKIRRFELKAWRMGQKKVKIRWSIRDNDDKGVLTLIFLRLKFDRSSTLHSLAYALPPLTYHRH